MIEAILTLVFMILFIGLCIWVYRPGAKEKYQAIGRIPFEDEQGASNEDLDR